MADKKEYVKLWTSYRTYFEAYSAAEVGRLVLAMMDYKSSGAVPEFSGSERFIWPAIQRDIDEATENQEKVSQERAKSGKKGGQARAAKLTDDETAEHLDKLKQNVAIASFDKQTQANCSKSSQGLRSKDKGLRKYTPPAPLQDDLSWLSDAGKKAVSRWMEYKQERKEAYKEAGRKAFLSTMRKNVGTYGEVSVIQLIDESMASGYKGVIWDKLQTRGLANAYVGRNIAPEDDVAVKRFDKLPKYKPMRKEQGTYENNS